MRFSDEYEYLIHLLRCYVRDEQPCELPKEFSFETVFQYGREHEVGNIAYLGIKKLEKKPDDELLKKWYAFYLWSVQRHYNQDYEHQRILDSFHQNNIRTLELQGTVAKLLYLDPQDRMMSDIDIVIDRENITPAQSLLEGLGYETTLNDDGSINAKKGAETMVEIHHTFYEKSRQWSDAFGKVFDGHFTKSEKGLSYIADDDTKYLYILAHTVRHFKNQCVGIRRILDLYFLNEKLGSSMNQDYVNQVLEKLGYTEDARLLLSLADYWFGNGKTFESDEIIRDIFDAGVHGNDRLSVKYALKESRKNKEKFPKLRHYLYWIFPPKDLIYEGYPKTREKKMTYFSCWFYRAFSILFSKEKKDVTKRRLSEIYNSDKK